MKYSYLEIKYKDNTIEFIKTNCATLVQKMLGDEATVDDIKSIIKAQPEELAKNNIMNWITENLSYDAIKIISHSCNVYRIPDVATKTEHIFLFDEG
jgi:hypothetical protein